MGGLKAARITMTWNELKDKRACKYRQASHTYFADEMHKPYHRTVGCDLSAKAENFGYTRFFVLYILLLCSLLLEYLAVSCCCFRCCCCWCAIELRRNEWWITNTLVNRSQFLPCFRYIDVTIRLQSADQSRLNHCIYVEESIHQVY